MLKGRFITIEGGEGAGKSTQIAMLKDAMAKAPFPVHFTREPGGTPASEAVRELLVTGDPDRWLPESEALLMMAARFEHVKRLIEPALAAGEWVVSDRFFDSTRVYQGIGKGLGEAWLQMLYSILFGNIKPDLTIYLDIGPEEGLKRTQSRSGNEHRFESMALEFHQQVRAGFQSIAKAEPQRVLQIDATQSVESVYDQIICALNERFSLTLRKQAA